VVISEFAKSARFQDGMVCGGGSSTTLDPYTLADFLSSIPEIQYMGVPLLIHDLRAENLDIKYKINLLSSTEPYSLTLQGESIKNGPRPGEQVGELSLDRQRPTKFPLDLYLEGKVSSTSPMRQNLRARQSLASVRFYPSSLIVASTALVLATDHQNLAIRGLWSRDKNGEGTPPPFFLSTTTQRRHIRGTLRSQSTPIPLPGTRHRSMIEDD